MNVGIENQMSQGCKADNDAGPGAVPAIEQTEKLYRRILPGAWHRPGADALIPQKYFMPRPWVSNEKPGDADGISVNRAVLIDAVRASERPDTRARVPLAVFSVSDVYQIGLTVLPKPIREDRSHAVIPELNSLDRRQPEKELQMEEWAMSLRNRARLVHFPSLE